MQVSFQGILRANLPCQSATQVDIKNKYVKAKAFEDVLNKRQTDLYNESEQRKILASAKRGLTDYTEPDESKGEEYQKTAGILRVQARDAIYYCTGNDIAKVKQKRNELINSDIRRENIKKELGRFVEKNIDMDRTGFIMLESSDGMRYDTFGMGESAPDGRFNCDFLNL